MYTPQFGTTAQPVMQPNYVQQNQQAVNQQTMQPLGMQGQQQGMQGYNILGMNPLNQQNMMGMGQQQQSQPGIATQTLNNAAQQQAMNQMGLNKSASSMAGSAV